MKGATKRSPVLGPAARIRCERCGRVFTVKPGHLIAHDRRQGAVYVNCDGVLAPDVPDGTGPARPDSRSSSGR